MRGDNPFILVRIALLLVTLVAAIGTVGYILLGLTPLEAVYQTVITVFSVGFSETGEVTSAYRVFTIFLVLGGTGTVLYTLTTVLETVLEGRLSDDLRRRRMLQRIDRLDGHVVVCGLGQVGTSLVRDLRQDGRAVVAVDRRQEPLDEVGGFVIRGDCTEDTILESAGVARAATLIVAMDHDADNLYVTLSARSMNTELFIVARANQRSAEPKLLQAGADRVVNPHRIGGARMAALVTQPHVAEFLDVVMHDRELEVRLAEIGIVEGSRFEGRTMGQCAIRERSGATVLALRRRSGGFDTNPGPATALAVGDIVIALGTQPQLDALRTLAAGPAEGA